MSEETPDWEYELSEIDYTEQLLHGAWIMGLHMKSSTDRATFAVNVQNRLFYHLSTCKDCNGIISDFHAISDMLISFSTNGCMRSDPSLLLESVKKFASKKAKAEKKVK